MRCIPVLLLCLAAAARADVVPGLQGLGDLERHSIEADAIGRSFQVIVGLPEGYAEAPDAAYPAVYILDGGELYPMLAAYYRYLRWGDEVPDLILVGISYGASDFADGNFRGTDYTAPSEEREFWGGAAEFQRFLADELLPAIESGYRARPDRRVLFGQSLGGQFVLYSAQTRPGLFWGRIASNPALHRNLPLFLGMRPDAAAAAPEGRLFVASGTDDHPDFRKPLDAWRAHWENTAGTPWRLRAVDLAGHSHFSAPPAAFRAGLSWLFAEPAAD